MQAALKTTLEETPPSAFHRALARLPHLAPAGPSFASFLAWRGHMTSSPASLEDLRGEHETMCELRGWPVPKPLAKATGPAATPWKQLPPGPYTAGNKATGKQLLTPQDAAVRFLDWMLATGLTGKWSDAELRSHYRNHCLATGLARAPENLMREALRDLPGASKYSTYKKVKGQRNRPVVWEIGKAEPMRRAA